MAMTITAKEMIKVGTQITSKSASELSPVSLLEQSHWSVDDEGVAPGGSLTAAKEAIHSINKQVIPHHDQGPSLSGCFYVARNPPSTLAHDVTS